MGYIRAEKILPIEIIELIQQYVDGTNIYIPRKTGNRRIYEDWTAGESVSELAGKYCLSSKSIWRILREMS